jgi:hypothetical protein
LRRTCILNKKSYTAIKITAWLSFTGRRHFQNTSRRQILLLNDAEVDMKKRFDLSDLETMTNLIDAVFSEMNIGLVVYQMEELDVSTSLKLVYANKQATKYSATDLSQSIGKYILEAFPMLANTGIPEQYAEVAKTKRSCNLGAFEYSGGDSGKSYYSLKAFPMPNDCVGVLFENITLRKQLEEMVRNLKQN